MYPEIEVQINASDQPLDMRTQDFDLAIRPGGPDCSSAAIMQEELFVPVYAPSLTKGKEVKAGDLLKYPLLAHLYSPLWDAWFKLNGFENQKAKIATGYSKSSLLVQAALAGGGVALTSVSIAADALKSGRLYCVKGEPLPTGDCYYLELAERLGQKKPQAKVDAFCEWLRLEFKQMDAELPEFWS